MPFAKAPDGTEIFFKDWGSGRPVVLIHGWPLNADMWEYQAPVLASAGLRVISYDRRGFGRSGQPWSGYNYDTLADDLAAVMDHLDLRDATLVGFSMGGGEVARYLSRHGAAGRVSRAVLVSAVTPFLLRTADNPDGVDRSVFDGMIEGLQKDRPNFLATFGKQFFGAGLLTFSISSELLQWASMLALQASPKATMDCVRAFSETDFRGRPRRDRRADAGGPWRGRRHRADRRVRPPRRADDPGRAARGICRGAARPVLHREGPAEPGPAGVHPGLTGARPT
ncbi:alpha/beta fold hydrolase [Teichococcus vastitatis]